MKASHKYDIILIVEAVWVVSGIFWPTSRIWIPYFNQQVGSIYGLFFIQKIWFFITKQNCYVGKELNIAAVYTVHTEFCTFSQFYI